MPDSEKPFVEIFKRLTAEEFMEDPTRILSLMMDFGFDSRQVRMIRTVMTEDMKEVREFFECPMGSGYEIIGIIAEYCLVSEKALIEILDGIRSSLHGNIKTEIIEDNEYGRCRRSTDGVATYSLDMTILYRVTDTDVFTIPNSVTKIERCAFEFCESLCKVVIPNSVTIIGEFAFRGCGLLSEVIIPDSVTKIGSYAFSGCTHAYFKVGKDNRCYSSYSGALFDKDGHILLAGYSLVHNGQCMIPRCVKIIGRSAFNNCKSLSEVIIPDSVTEIRSWAFDCCYSLCNVVIPDSVTEIDNTAFRGCTHAYFKVGKDNRCYSSDSGELFDNDGHILLAGYSLVHNGKCMIPGCVKIIGGCAFIGCKSLSEIIIPDSVTKIGSLTFCGCSSLCKVVIPDSVTEIGSWAFYDCDSARFIVDQNNRNYYSQSGKLIKR